MLRVRTYWKVFLLIAVISLALGGCQGRATGPLPAAQAKIGFQLESPELASLVHIVTLTMRFFPPDSTVTDTLTLVNGEVHDTVLVTPADSVIFTLRAFDAQGNLLYIGSETRPVRPGEQTEVNILLSPNPQLLMLRAGPFFQSVLLSAEDTVAVHVDVYNVDSLFGASFRIRYDTLVLSFSHAIEGDFIKGSPPVETFAGVIRDTLDYVAYFVSRVRGAAGVPPGVSTASTPGRLATFVFTTRGRGTSAVTIDRKTAMLTRSGPNERPVDGFETLVLESATVEVR